MRIHSKKQLLPLLAVALLIMLAGCGTDKRAAQPEKAAEEVAVVTAADDNSVREVENIVFVGLKESCACTRNRIDESWRVLQNTLALTPGLTVERIQRDVDKEAALALHRVKPLLVAPGIYFINGENQVIELLQGEVTEEQLLQVLGETGS